MELECLDKKKASLIAAVRDEIIAGKLEQSSRWSNGKPNHTQSNMNTNEIIPNRAHYRKAINSVKVKTLYDSPNDM